MKEKLLVHITDPEAESPEKLQIIEKLSWYFILLFICYNAGAQMISQIYDKRNLKSVGQICFFALHFGFFLSSMIVDNLIKRFNRNNHTMKTCMSLSVLFYTLYQLASAYTCWCTTPSDTPSTVQSGNLACSYGFLVGLNILCSFILGFFGSTMLMGV